MDLVNLGLVFWEKQEGQLCAQHALNAVLQGPYFSAVDLSQIARDLDSQELDALADGATTPPTPHSKSSIGLESRLDTIQQPFHEVRKEDPASQNAYILNLNEHWLTLRRFGGSRNRWYNLDSTLDGPKYVSEFYLQALLTELGVQGYSIFVVAGELISSDADSYALSSPVPPPQPPLSTASAVKEAGKGGVQAFSGKGYSLSGSSASTSGGESFGEDPELAAAIAMSMEATKPAETQMEEMRRKRLEAFNKRN